MQGQQTQHLAVTAKQSLQVIQTLLRVSFGCVAYLRDLLPDDNFTDGRDISRSPLRLTALTCNHVIKGYLSASGNDSLSQSDLFTDSGRAREKNRPPSGAIKVKTIKKDFSTEGNKLIQYLEEGIFDALEKQYLRSFIFAVYLDDEEPENIVEAYTFNFSYHTIAGSTSKVPIMTLGERLEKMSLDIRSASRVDPATESIMKGIAPTLGDVKRSVKNLVKTLITSMQLLHALPKRRFGTFKLFYVDHVPDDYEPPHFTPGDASNKYFFTTHAGKEIPEKISVGSLATSHHGVELHIASISEVIPRTGESLSDAANFGGLVDHEPGSYSAIQHMTLAQRSNLIDVQHQDALLRNVVWDAEAFANPDDDADAEGENDPEYQELSNKNLCQTPKNIIRTDETIPRLSQTSVNEAMAPRAFSGLRIDEPDSVRIIRNGFLQQEMTPTQEIEPTQCVTPSPLFNGNLPSHMSVLLSAEDQEESPISHGIETPLVQGLLEQRDPEQNIIQDSEMLDLETQFPIDNLNHHAEDPITSYSNKSSALSDEVMNISRTIRESSQDGMNSISNEQAAEVTECDCGILEEEDHGSCQCEGPCGRWLHIWCMGYHSVNDPRLPHVFHCFTCRLRNDPQIEVLDSRNLTSEYISKFKDLSFFRRALKTVEVHRPDNVTRFKELLGSEVSIAGQAWKRLEAEGFIAIQTIITDDIGLLEMQGTSSRKGKTKKKQVRKNLKRAKYTPVPGIMASKAFQDYFEPAKEASLLGMTKLRHASIARQSKNQDTDLEPPVKNIKSQTQLSVQADPESQTQSETQFSMQDDLASSAQLKSGSSKRKNADQVRKNTKRLKISVGLGINLED